MQCNSNRKQSNSNLAITLLLQLNISITPRFNFTENNQTKKIRYFDLLGREQSSCSVFHMQLYLFPNSCDKIVQYPNHVSQ